MPRNSHSVIRHGGNLIFLALTPEECIMRLVLAGWDLTTITREVMMQRGSDMMTIGRTSTVDTQTDAQRDECMNAWRKLCRSIILDDAYIPERNTSVRSDSDTAYDDDAYSKGAGE
jgi:hypothetical protein